MDAGDNAQLGDASSARYRYQLVPDDLDDSERASFDDLPKIPSAEYGRITVLLGINGSGKSRVLSAFLKRPIVDGAMRTTVYVEGGRAIKFSAGSSKTQRSWPSNHAQLSAKYREQVTLNDRLSAILTMMLSADGSIVDEHKNALFHWDLQGAVYPKPIQVASPLNVLCETFSALFPGLVIEPKQGVPWWCRRSGKDYQISHLSDGEKQVLCLLADVGILSPRKALIIVDEPELNLHPTLADSLWRWIEQQRPESVFVYATHSLPFAMHPGVTDVLILSTADREPLHLKNPFHWPADELRPFLGSLPAVMISKKLLVAEGESDEAFDALFYEWLTGDFRVSNVGCADNVRAAVKRTGLYEKIGDVQIVGVVDRDYRSENSLKRFDGCIVLPYHEAESYLCHPSILAHASGFAGSPTTENEMINRLVEQCHRHLIPTALRRTFERSTIRMSVATRKNEPRPENFQAALDAVRESAADEGSRAEEFKRDAETIFKEEHKRCSDAIQLRDVDQMLTLFPGKEMLAPLGSSIGFATPEHLLTSVTDNLNVDMFPPLVKIRDAIAKTQS